MNFFKWPSGGMADTVDSKPTAERHEGSTPSLATNAVYGHEFNSRNLQQWGSLVEYHLW
jgi:hypothetical protein